MPGWLNYALAHGRPNEARVALAYLEKNLPEDAAVARQLLPWALREPGVDAGKLRVAMAAAPSGEVSNYLVARRDTAAYNDFMENGGAILQAYYFMNLYRSKPTGQAMLREPSVKLLLVKYGFPVYWREKGWPAGCRPLGTDDFECGIDAAVRP